MPLRIELWAPSPCSLSGGNLYNRRLVRELEAQGHRVAVVSDGFGSFRAESDVVVQDALWHREFLASGRGRTGAATRPRIVGLVHHPMSEEPERSDAEREALRRSERDWLSGLDGLLAPSRASADAALSILGRRVPVAVAPPGRDQFAGGEVPSPLPGPDEIAKRAAGPLRAVFAANLIPRKRLLELLDALAVVPDWSLEVAGREDVDEVYTDAVRERAASDDLAGRVRFHGALEAAALAKLFRESVLLAMPSSHEGFGMVYLEGFAFGLPALAAASGGAVELVSGSETGFLVPPDTPTRRTERIVHHLRALATDRDRLAGMGVKASERWRSHPSWKESAAIANALFEKLIQD